MAECQPENVLPVSNLPFLPIDRIDETLNLSIMKPFSRGRGLHPLYRLSPTIINREGFSSITPERDASRPGRKADTLLIH